MMEFQLKLLVIQSTPEVHDKVFIASETDLVMAPVGGDHVANGELGPGVWLLWWLIHGCIF